MTENERLVRDFVGTWKTLDAARIAAFFTEDGVYHNMPMAPVRGRETLVKFIGGFIKSWSATEWDILSIAVADNTVFCERLDRTRMGEKSVDLPCCGVFEIRDGKIAVWRDYFDLATFANAAT